MQVGKVNTTEDYDFCVIVPVFNEEDNISMLNDVLGGYIKKSSVKTCILFIDDGSSDSSRSLLIEICHNNPDFFYAGFTKNNGLSAAIKAGIDLAQSKWIGYIDADLQTSPDDFELLLPHRNEYALMMGIRQGRKDSFVKKISSKIANSFRRMMTGDGIEDTGCPLKIIDSEYAKRMPLFNGMHRFIPALIQLQNGNVIQIPVRHFERIAGKSKFHLSNRLLAPFVDCFAFRWMKKRYINYELTIKNQEARNKKQETR